MVYLIDAQMHHSALMNQGRLIKRHDNNGLNGAMKAMTLTGINETWDPLHNPSMSFSWKIENDILSLIVILSVQSCDILPSYGSLCRIITEKRP